MSEIANRVTSVGKKISVDVPERCSAFSRALLSVNIYLIGVKTVKLRTTGNEKMQLSVDTKYEAKILSPMAIFKNLTKAPKGTFPKGMVIEGTVTVQIVGKKAGMFFPVGQIWKT